VLLLTVYVLLYECRPAEIKHEVRSISSACSHLCHVDRGGRDRFRRRSSINFRCPFSEVRLPRFNSTPCFRLRSRRRCGRRNHKW